MDSIDSYMPILEAGIYVVLMFVLLAIAITLYLKGGIPLLHGVDTASLSEKFTIRNPVTGKDMRLVHPITKVAL